ncbi:MAG TPA: class I SAM-dependent methyltransferase [Burkholderiales bacterium]|jgi:SAM-dependent methyltransferase|nr:class I SAM-dependent methyltransferase [Burkholderiales bacterium]
MSTPILLRRLAAALVLSFIAAGSGAQDKASEGYQPEVGQEGKDVIWVPTPQALVDKMLDMAKVTPQDYVVDLGSGDGRTVITAAKRGARALGIEYNPKMVALSKRNAEKEKVSEMAQFRQADLFKTDFSDATVLTMFLLPDINIKLRPKILDMKPGTRVVSNSFTMEDWQPDETSSVPREEGCESYCTAYLWIVPAKVEGTWRFGDAELSLNQKFQMVFGRLKRADRLTPVSGGRLNGDEIRFNIGDAAYFGRVRGDVIEGTVRSGGRTEKWHARRTSSS